MEQQAPMKAPKYSRSRTKETRRGVYLIFGRCFSDKFDESNDRNSLPFSLRAWIVGKPCLTL